MRVDETSDEHSQILERRVIIVSSTVIVWVILASVLLLNSSVDDLPIGFFALIALGLSAIVASILIVPVFTNRHLKAVLVQLVVLWVFSRLAQSYQFVSILGGDTYAHLS